MAAPAEAGSLSQCKVVVVGDGTVGKTCMLWVYAKKEFPKKYVPTVFDNYVCVIPVNGKPINLSIWDTAGQEEYDKLRTLSYKNTSVFIICFAVDNRASYSNVKDHWVQEIRKYQKDSPIVLVATKSDLRESGTRTIGPQEGEDLRRTIGAVAYIECSAKQNQGIKDVFDKALVSYLSPPASSPRIKGPEVSPRRKEKKSACTIL
eukprot:NODE_5714_length_978_cov_91.327485_g5134_i0.p1 GENE.NODE_5714_length_978_cov_91.327485_g5134_i0~~NODE_5714_length_978_cov_91.327485_g5134_i0.p1  ORF type:complete len:205 (+),score=32.62 NODE_5714_length_978_cov_91.327485_g5134_i0:62-676(+)